MLCGKPAGCRHELCVRSNLYQNDLGDEVLKELYTVRNISQWKVSSVASPTLVSVGITGARRSSFPCSYQVIWRFYFHSCARRGKKWVYALVVLRGSSALHFKWAHPANAHIGGSYQCEKAHGRRAAAWKAVGRADAFLRMLSSFSIQSTERGA